MRKIQNLYCICPLHHENRELLSEVVIEPLESVTNKWQAHLGRLLGSCASAVVLDGLGLEQSCVVGLINLVGREVGGVDVGRQARLERSANATQAIKVDTAEERVALELMGTSPSKSVLRVADHAVQIVG